MTIKMIVATGLNGEIGKDNKLLWHIKEDMEYFKKTTLGQPVVMGRKTLDSLPLQFREKGLPNRTNIVMTRNAVAGVPEYIVFNSVEQVLDFHNLQKGDVWIIGGVEIYELFKDYIEEIHLTIVYEEYPEADRFLDLDFTDGFKLVETIPFTKDLELYSECCIYRRKVGEVNGIKR